MTAEISSLYMRVRITVENMERGKKKRKEKRGGKAAGRDGERCNGKTERRRK